MKDYYKILGVAKNASSEDIKRAYRRLASQHHPDKGGNKSQFQEIQEAYSVLGDDAKRQQYDIPTSQTHFNFNFTGSPAGMNIDDILNMFGAGVHRRDITPRIDLWISLEDVARGGPRPISLQINNVGTTVQIDIPVGINDGDTVRYPKILSDGKDLIITYKIKKDTRWQRNGRDITGERKLSIYDLILGTEIPIEDLSGSTLMLSIPPRTQPDSLLRIRGRGLPASSLPGKQGGPHGDLFIRVHAFLPDNLPEYLIDALRSARGH